MIATQRITIDDYWRMVAEGQFQDRRVELIGGEIVPMSPQSNWHGISILDTYDAIIAIFDRRQYFVRNQMTIDLGPLSHPDPDIAVVLGSRRQWSAENINPDHAILIVEVSDSTLHDDLARKASLYAASNIADYWIVNLQDRQLEVRRTPVPNASEPFSSRYESLTILSPHEFATPLSMPTAQVAVADLLPN